MTASIDLSYSPAPHTPYGGEHIIVVCRMCRKQQPDSVCARMRAGEQLAEAAADAASGCGVRVREVACLGNCQKGLNAAILSTQGWSYLFSGLTPTDGEALVTGATLLTHSGDGQIPWSDWPEALKRTLVARIPSPDNLE